MIYVFDATAFVAIWREASSQSSIFDELADLVVSGNVVFNDQVVDELERISDATLVQLVKAMKRDRADDGADYSYMRAIATQIPHLIDDEATGEEASLPTLAQALALRDRGEDVVVVTDDYLEKPTRTALSDACRTMGIEWMLPRKCLDELGLEQLLV